MRTTYVIPAALVIAVLTGCAAPRHAGGPGTGTTAVILYRHSPFNLDMTDRVREYLELQRYRVIVDEAHNAGRYRAESHAAVIFLVKNEAEREIRAVENFLNRNRRAGNIIVSVSHEWGEPVPPERQKSLDAITAASRREEQDRVFSGIRERLRTILGSGSGR